MTWAERYVGQEAGDCALLVERVLKEVFGKEVQLPSERSGAFGDSHRIKDNMDDFVKPTQAPEDGDGVLIRSRGRLEHIGIYVSVKGRSYVLHSMAGIACLHAVSQLPFHHMQVSGYYRWV